MRREGQGITTDPDKWRLDKTPAQSTTIPTLAEILNISVTRDARYLGQQKMNLVPPKET